MPNKPIVISDTFDGREFTETTTFSDPHQLGIRTYAIDGVEYDEGQWAGEQLKAHQRESLLSSGAEGE